MLEFNPAYRNSVQELIAHKAFDSIRVKKIEKGAPYKIYLEVDQAGAYDYEQKKDLVHFSEKGYREEIISMANKYRKYN